MSKRILSVIMVLCLIMAMAPAAFATGEEPAWDGVTTEAIPDSGEITNGAQLAWLSEQVNSGNSFSTRTFTLMNDIDLGNKSFIPIGNSDNEFKGTFDGNNKTIKNATITGYTSSSGNRDDSVLRAGIFGTVSGTVKNLVLDNIDVTSTATDIGSGFLNDDNEAATGVAIGTLEGGTADCITVLSSCSVEGNIRVGGIIGDCRGSATISNCVNNVVVDGGNNYTGGIVGAAHDGSGADITYCTNNGAVNGTNEVGGIVGYADRSNINNCKNYGTVTGTGNYGTGGILGCDIFNYTIALFSPSNGSTIESCENHGNVTAPRAGGILGAFVVAPSKDQKSRVIYSTIDGCTNTGAVSGTKAGAIYGASISYKSGDSTSVVGNMKADIKNCFVGGSVNSTALTAENFLTYISADANFISESGNTFFSEAELNA